MPAQLSYPGVYVEEVPSAVRTILGVPTSVTAFVGRARRGPVHRATTLNSFADFERTFGGLWEDAPLSYAVRDFFANGGGQAIVVRLYHPFFADDAARTAAFTAAEAQAAAAAGHVVHAARQEAGKGTPDGAATAAEEYAAGLPAGSQKTGATAAAQAARDEATAGGTADDVATAAEDHAAALPNGDEKTGATSAAAEARSVADATPATPDGVADAAEAAEAANPDAAREASQAVAQAARTAAGQGTATAASVATAAANARDGAVADAANRKAPVTVAQLGVGGLTLRAASEGRWGNQLRARVDHDVRPGDLTLFNLRVKDAGTGMVEVHRNVSFEAGNARRVDHVLEQESRLVRAAALPGARPAATSVPPTPPPPGSDPFDLPSTATVTGPNGLASDGGPPTLTDYQGSQDLKTGMYALEQADLFNLLCIPPPAFPTDLPPEVWNEAARYCEQRRAVLLVDPPAVWKSKDDVKKATNGLADLANQIGGNRKNAALYFPRLRQANPLRDQRLEDFAPCGAVAGLIARTDGQRGLWKAPAGQDAVLSGVQSLTVGLTDMENGELNPLGVNCMRTLPAAGHVVWGARTMEGADRLASQWKYLPVRRMALHIEESLYRGTQWAVFEPNDEPLWAQIRMNVGAFMHDLFRKGAFQGASPKEAYLVKCDAQTTTQDDIDRGVVNILVGFAPLKPAEFVVLKISQLTRQEGS